jgi:hypothetical protein
MPRLGEMKRIECVDCGHLHQCKFLKREVTGPTVFTEGRTENVWMCKWCISGATESDPGRESYKEGDLRGKR